MNEKKTFSEAIVKLRKEQGMTQKELANKLNVSDKAVSRWETGKNYPDIETLKRMASVLGVSVDELLDGEIEIPGKKARRKKLIIATMLIALLLYIFPFYHCIMASTTNTFGAAETAYLAFRGLPSHHFQVRDIMKTAEAAFSDIGLTREEAQEKYGLLSRYCITSNFEEVVKEKHNLRVWSVMLNTYMAEHDGYIWVYYSQEGLDKNGQTVTGGWRIPAIWYLDNQNGQWKVVDIKEHP